jgi:GAF domain-containing protein
MHARFGIDDNLTIKISEFLITTADHDAPLLDGKIGIILRTLRERLKLDAVFVGEFVGDERVLRFVDSSDSEFTSVFAPGGSSPLEHSLCLRVADGRLPGLVRNIAGMPAHHDVPPMPMRIGAHLGAPIVLRCGRLYGTLCGINASPNPWLREHDLAVLRHCAELVAHKIGLADAAVREAQARHDRPS